MSVIHKYLQISQIFGLAKVSLIKVHILLSFVSLVPMRSFF